MSHNLNQLRAIVLYCDSNVLVVELPIFMCARRTYHVSGSVRDRTRNAPNILVSVSDSRESTEILVPVSNPCACQRVLGSSRVCHRHNAYSGEV